MIKLEVNRTNQEPKVIEIDPKATVKNLYDNIQEELKIGEFELFSEKEKLITTKTISESNLKDNDKVFISIIQNNKVTRTDDVTPPKEPENIKQLLQELKEMGFNDEEKNKEALLKSFYQIPRATDFLLSNNFAQTTGNPLISKAPPNPFAYLLQDPNNKYAFDTLKQRFSDEGKNIAHSIIIQYLNAVGWDLEAAYNIIIEQI